MRPLRWLPALIVLLGLGVAPAGGGDAGPTPTCPARFRLNCLLRRRQGCGPAGIRSCGPCLRPYYEDSGGDCVLRKPHRHEDSAKAQAGASDLAALIRSLVAKKRKELRTRGTDSPQHASSMGLDPPGSSPTETPPTSALPPPTRPPSTPVPSTGPPQPEEDVNMGPPAPRLPEAVSLLLVLMCTVTGVAGLLVAALCWYRLQQEVRLAQKTADATYRRNHYRYHQPGMYMDARLAQACQVHHFQHQKKVLTNEESPPKPVQQLSTESETESGEYTVYECPGLAPSGEMEIHNPLFGTGPPLAPPRQRPPAPPPRQRCPPSPAPSSTP
ncbi:neural proliferation differentiation and control protein 1-like [Carettochelys insculpta]|uniref:neural proliferation differentiation and control protein 1-like n=1 Tax=Carettochelys insculpta TaxID=44489 RepID=UPI003EBDA1C3